VCGILENFGFRQLLALFKVQAFWEYLRGLRRWGMLERAGFEKGEPDQPLDQVSLQRERVETR
jgi:hypothetical protein